MYQCDHCGARFNQAPQGGRPAQSHMFRCPQCKRITFLASGLLQKKDPVTIHVYSLPAFYQHWLAPRLEQYQEGNPWIEFKVDLSEELAPLGGPGLQLALRYGVGAWPDLWKLKLFPQQTDVMGFYLVCQPQQQRDATLEPLIQWLAHQGQLSAY
ncbi:MAG: hypothetical protein RRB13_04805 [bacterium]|nr:hypothetical protein [bacterium]